MGTCIILTWVVVFSHLGPWVQTHPTFQVRSSLGQRELNELLIVTGLPRGADCLRGLSGGPKSQREPSCFPVPATAVRGSDDPPVATSVGSPSPSPVFTWRPGHCAPTHVPDPLLPLAVPFSSLRSTRWLLAERGSRILFWPVCMHQFSQTVSHLPELLNPHQLLLEQSWALMCSKGVSELTHVSLYSHTPVSSPPKSVVQISL